MPLADFVRYLNAQLPYPPSGLASTTPFVSEGGRVHVNYQGLCLVSAFSPIVGTVDGALRGHVARLQAIDLASDRQQECEAVYALPGDAQAFMFLDRLVRTLHTLNYLTYRDRQSRELLLLKVHPRHVASVAADHGLAFEEILRSCGLMPEQITLEFDVANLLDSGHLVRAIANYRSRGYGIAIGPVARIDFELLSAIGPAIVRLDARRLGEPLLDVIDRLHDAGAQAMVERLDGEASGNSAQAKRFDFVQRQAPSGRFFPWNDLTRAAA